jgi:hypothetical protein
MTDAAKPVGRCSASVSCPFHDLAAGRKAVFDRWSRPMTTLGASA